MTKVLIFIFLTTVSCFSQQNKQLEFYNTDWGRTVSWDAFCERTKASGYDGIEIWFPSEKERDLLVPFKKPTFKLCFFRFYVQKFGNFLVDIVRVNNFTFIEIK